MAPVTERVDAVVIGGGIVGLATALALLEARPSIDLVVVEKEGRLGVHQTGHNSGVVHSGIYYRPGTLKARLCAEGRRRMVDFCRAEGVPLTVCGKLVIATRRHEVGRLQDLQRRGLENGLAGVERLGRAGITDHEPAAAGLAGLWVPETGVTDFGAVATRLGVRLVGSGAAIVTGAPVDRVEPVGFRAVVRSGNVSWSARLVVNAAGLQADRLAQRSGIEPPATIVPFRGNYRRLADAAAHLVRGLIYPVPDPRFPFLGVHLTRRVDGVVEAGPNAVPALGREQYRPGGPDWAEVRSLLRSRAVRRMALRYARPGIAELLATWGRSGVTRGAVRLVPGLRPSDFAPGGSGVRAQAVRPDGSLADDFVIAGQGPVLHVISAPSPAATAALAIGDHLAAMALANAG
jgi:L-2-hydroxyglutarate oxidase LhgO